MDVPTSGDPDQAADIDLDPESNQELFWRLTTLEANEYRFYVEIFREHYSENVREFKDETLKEDKVSTLKSVKSA